MPHTDARAGENGTCRQDHGGCRVISVQGIVVPFESQNPKESQTSDITQLVSGWALSDVDVTTVLPDPGLNEVRSGS